MVLGGAVGMLRFQALNLLLNDMRFFTKKKKKKELVMAIGFPVSGWVLIAPLRI